MNRVTDAKALIDQAHKADSRAASAFDVEGLLAEGAQQREQARTAYASAIELGSMHYFPYVRWAALTLRQGAEPETLARVEQRLERATSLNDRFAAAHALRGEVRSQRGRHDEAVAAARRAVALDARSASSRMTLARVLWNGGKQDEALREARAALPLTTNEEERRLAQETIDTFQQRLAASRQALPRQPQAAAQTNGATTTSPRPPSAEEARALGASCQGGDKAACETLLPYVQTGCEQGFADACTSAGAVLFRGPIANPTNAAGYFGKACSGGAKIGCVMAAVMQGQGMGVPRNEPAAATTLEQLCNEKIREACLELVSLLMRRSTQQDTARARELLTATCKDGFARACEIEAQLPPVRR
jgi:tetratricopeptide (TPR) repeat protein